MHSKLSASSSCNHYSPTVFFFLVAFPILSVISCKPEDRKPTIVSISKSDSNRFRYSSLDEAQAINRDKTPNDNQVFLGFQLRQSQSSVQHRLGELKLEGKFIKYSAEELEKNKSLGLKSYDYEYKMTVNDSTRIFFSLEPGFNRDELSYFSLRSTTMSEKGSRHDFEQLLTFWKSKFGEPHYFEKDEIGRECYYWFDGYKETCVIFNTLYGEYSRIEYRDINAMLSRRKEMKMSEDRYKDSLLKQQRIEVERTKNDLH